MASLLDNMFSCETTKYINKEFKYSLRADSLLPARCTNYFCTIFFVKVDKNVFEDANEVRIKIKGTIRFNVSMPDLQFYRNRYGDYNLQNSMHQEINKIWKDTINNIYVVANQICENAFFVYGKINKRITVVPEINVETDGQYI